jgi:hypothetical protein
MASQLLVAAYHLLLRSHGEAVGIIIKYLETGSRALPQTAAAQLQAELANRHPVVASAHPSRRQSWLGLHRESYAS